MGDRARGNEMRLELPDARVAVCGDWHGNEHWLRGVAPAIRRLAPDVTTILQLGDWWTAPAESDRIFLAAGIQRVLVTLGNHEPWDRITPMLAANPGVPARISEVTWLLPRPYRFGVGRREVLSLGGAASVDRLWRRPGVDWWPDEAIIDEHVAMAIAGGPADLMLTHESPEATPVNAVQRVLASNPHSFPQETLRESAASRQQVQTVWDAVRPELLIHGHMHVAGGGATADGRRVTSLAADQMQGHVVFLDLATLRMQVPSLRDIHAAGGPPS